MEDKGTVQRKEKKSKSKRSSSAPKPEPEIPPPEDEPKIESINDKPLKSKKSKSVTSAAFPAHAPESLPSKPKTPLKDSNISMLSETGDDYDDDDFDDYDDDDFEDEDHSSPKKPTPKKPEAKKAPPPARPPAPAPGKFTKRASKYGGSSKVQLSSKYSKSTPLTTFNPAAKRIQNIKSQTRMSSQSFVALDQVPATKYQVYASKLKSKTVESSTGIREFAIQHNAESRPAECQTDEISYEDKELLTRNGEDDTDFENLLACCQRMDLVDLKKYLPTKKVAENEVGEDDDFNGFLGRASKVMEGLCEENLMRFGGGGRKAAGRRDGLWEGGGNAVKFGEDKEQTINQILEGREMSAILCSGTQATTVYTVHPDSGKEGGNELTGKSIICSWETYQPSKPSRILVCEGVVTACALTDKSHVIVAGTDDGVVIMWDLREGRGAHIKNVPLKIPSYSTSHLSFGSGAHSSKVVCLCVGDGGANVNSIDDRGMMTTWFISEAKAEAGGVGGDIDLGLGVGGGLKLTQSRTVWVTENGMRQVELNYLSEDGRMGFGPEVTGMWTFLEGARNNYFLVARGGGKMLLCDKFSGIVKPYASEGLGDVGGVSFNNFVEGVFLVARADESVEMYSGSEFGVVMKWGSECWGGKLGDGGFSVEWSPHRPALFYVYRGGRAYYVDLMEDDGGAGVEGGQDMGMGGSVKFLGVTKGSKNVGKVAMIGGGDGGVLGMRTVCEEMVTEVERLSDDSELDWMKDWVESVTF